MRLERDKRYLVETDDTTKVVRFNDFQGVEQSCRVRNYSRTGLAFAMEDGSLVLRIGDVINDLRFYSLNKEVHRGPVTIVHIQDEEMEDKVISQIGCNFVDASLDINAIIKGDKISKLQNDFMDFIRSMALEDNLDPEFVNLTSHLHYLFTGFQERLAQDEEQIEQEDPEVRHLLTETLRELAFDALYEEAMRYYDRFSRITSRFTHSKQHFIHREFFQKRLMNFYVQSRLFNRAYTKPLGYAGDFEMMNIIYRNEFEGEDVFSQVMNKLECEGAAAKAVRNRRTYLYEKLTEAVSGLKKGSTIKIFSVACGPALEFFDILLSLQGKSLPFQVDFIGMDQDKLALEDARSRVEPMVKGRKDIKVNFVEDNIKRLIVGKEIEKELYADADFIYTAGLFDYLSDRAANRLIHKLFGFLKPEALLIVGNFGLYNPQRFIMEYGGEWFLIHRSEDELKSLAEGLPEDTTIVVEKEPEGVNLFLNIRKAAYSRD